MWILSWNLCWRYGPWERRPEAIAATLAEVNPDLGGLQEIWGQPGTEPGRRAGRAAGYALVLGGRRGDL